MFCCAAEVAGAGACRRRDGRWDRRRAESTDDAIPSDDDGGDPANAGTEAETCSDDGDAGDEETADLAREGWGANADVWATIVISDDSIATARNSKMAIGWAGVFMSSGSYYFLFFSIDRRMCAFLFPIII